MAYGNPAVSQSYHERNQHIVEKTFNVSVQPAQPSEESDDAFSWKEKVKSSMDRFWILEAVSLFISLGALMGIVGLLEAYDNKPLPEWKSSGTLHIKKHVIRHYTVSLTLNSLLSIIATIYKIALGIPVAASLGQLKWIWFSRGQKLSDFQAFDSAKGVLGSLMLLWKLRARRLACLAAVVTLGSVALDFAFQSMVTYPLLPKSIGLSASLPTASLFQNFVAEYNGGHPTGVIRIDQAMMASIYTGVFDLNRTSLVTPLCPSGNCAWNATTPNITTYASLGVCGRCQDSTAHLQKSCARISAESNTDNPVTGDPYNITVPYCNFTLPNGLSMPGMPNGTYTFMTSSSAIQNITQFTNLSNPFSILSTIRSNWSSVYENGTQTYSPEEPQTTDENGSPLPSPLGELYAPYLGDATSTECALYYCVRFYNADVINGTFKEHVEDTYQNDTVGDISMINSSYLYDPVNITLTIPTSWTLEDEAPRTFITTDAAWLGTFQQFQNFWDGSVQGVQSDPSVGAPSYSSDIVQTIFQLDGAGVERTIENLAQALTTNIRQSSSEIGLGTAYQFVPYVVVAWGWITLPVSLLLIALVLLASTIFKTRQIGTRLWKTSSLAAFYHPLTEGGRGRVSEAKDKTHLDKISEEVNVKWAKTEKGWRLIPVDGEETSRKNV